MNTENIITYIEAHWGVILTIVGFLVSVIWLKLDSRYAKKGDIHALHAKHDKLEAQQTQTNSRVDTLENTLEHLPSKDDFNQLALAIERLVGNSKETNAVVKRVERQVDLLMENEVKGG